MPVEMQVESIRVSLYAAPRIVVLKEMNRERYLPIVIGVPELCRYRGSGASAR